MLDISYICVLTICYSNVFYILAGKYTGQTLIARPNVIIYGETHNSSSYMANKVTLSDNMPANRAGSDDLSGTLRIHATGVKLYNLNIENTYGLPEIQSQAIALSVQAGDFGCYFCNISGHQDTLFTNHDYQVIRTPVFLALWTSSSECRYQSGLRRVS